MTTWDRVQGDVLDTITPQLNGIQDLTTAASIEAHVWANGGERVTLAAEVLDAAERTVTVHLGGVDGWLASAERGRYWVEVQVTFLDGSIVTWPSASPDTINVRAQGDPTP